MSRSQRTEQTAEVHFRGNLPYRLTVALSMVADASAVDGLDPQTYVLRASLPAELRQEIDLILGPLGKHVLLRHLWRDEPEIDEFSSFVAWVSQIGSEAICDAINASLHRFAAEEAFRTGRNVPGPTAYDEPHLRAFLSGLAEPWRRTAKENPETFDRILRLLQDPTGLKAHLVLILTQFWSAHYRETYGECTSTVERSLRHYTTRPPTGEVASIIRTITGRDMTDESRSHAASVRRIVFVPSCHAGLVVSPIPLDRSFETLLIPYNARTSGGRETLEASARDLFPMVKALSDETRLLILQMLKGGELYAQQIVDRLDLSQSSVSRHLSLLSAGGILNSRWDGGMKFYRINENAIDRLTKGLNVLATEGQDEGEGGEPLR